MLRFVPLVLANLGRRRARTALTLASVATAFLLYGVLEAMRYALSGGVELTGADRLITTHKISIIQPLPGNYLQRIRAVDGVRVACGMNWFGGMFQNERGVIVAEAVDQDAFFEIYPEMLLPAAQRRAWQQDTTGALIGESLARSHGWKLGDVIPLQSNIYRRKDGTNTWDLKIDGIYRIKNDAGDTNALFFGYKFFNESRNIGRDNVGWVVLRVTDPGRSAEVARRIDALFANSSTETKSSSERAFAQTWINQIGNVGAIITAVVSAVFFTMLLVTANTMAQAIRERTAELAVMKTLGYSGRLILSLVLLESMLLTALGGGAGLALATLITHVAGQSLRQYLPLLMIPTSAYLLGAGFALGLGLLSGAMPAWQAWRLQITQALRRV